MVHQKKVGWTLDVLKMCLAYVFGQVSDYLDVAPPQFRFLTRKSKSQPVHALGVGYAFGKDTMPQPLKSLQQKDLTDS